MAANRQAGLALAILLAAGAPAAAQCRLADLQWLQGTWRSDDAQSLVEERWSLLPSGQLTGAAWSAHPARPGGSQEAEAIFDDAGTVTLRLRHFDPVLAHAVEEKDAPMVFTAASCDGAQVVFDGQGARAGEHIGYRRSGGSLTFIGDFLHQGKPFHVEQTFMRNPP
jgi:hypothetical protein